MPTTKNVNAVTLRSVQYPGLYNFKPTNLKNTRKSLAKVRAGVAPFRLVTMGDSTNFGQGAGTGVSGTIGARPKAYPAYLAKILSGMGVPAHGGSIFGNGGLTDADYLAYDTRLALGAGWAQSVVTSLSARTWTNNSTTNALNFTPTETFDTIEIGYLQNSGYGTFTVAVDGGAVAGTYNASNATQALQKVTVTVARGTHTINIARTTGGAVHISYIAVSDSTIPAVHVMNVGWSGSATSTWDSVASAWSPGNAIQVLAPDLTIINLGINNWRATPPVDVQTFKTQYQNTITRAKVSGDVILLIPVPSDNTSATPANQAAYTAAIYELADANDLPVINMTQRFGSHAEANALGFYFDTLHPNALGYADMAQLVAKALLV